ncbi:unnamed protein product [Brassicogethes aeneus]|uniref:Glucose-6-phosphate 1-epimerase n=1 Tax=Brassicogethes aeneus TaxID=1431903 RepID=A0A9P0FEX1_BRAAE|nr:unnamed protein product [Brassicogethes aeneus]
MVGKMDYSSGCITSWRIYDKEQLFTSTVATSSYLKRIRGGISYSFPYLGQSFFGPEDGFLEKIQWEVETPPEKLKNKDVTVTLKASDTDYTRSISNCNWKVNLVIFLREKSLETEFTVTNTGKYYPMGMMLRQNVHMCLPNVFYSSISGFEDFKNETNFFNIKYDVLCKEDLEKPEVLSLVYLKSPDEFSITETEGEGTIKVIKDNQPHIHFHSECCKFEQLDRYLEDEQNYNCFYIKTGNFKDVKYLRPEESHSVKFSLEKIFPGEDNDAWMYEDIFKNYC